MDKNQIPKYFPVILFILGLTMTSFGQHTIRGRVIDENAEPLSYATVALLNPVDSILQYFGVTNDQGAYQMRNVKTGIYVMQYSYVGMKTNFEDITLTSDQDADLGDHAMASTTLDEVTIIEEYIPVTFRSDTVEFNSKAFTTKTNAVVEDLLKKIPGIEVDEAGNMKALGEDVNKVLVDGKEFFGKDPKVATKNLPAEAVAKVQVYDKKSDEAEFSGIDDGVRDRTINLMLNEDHKKGYFGNVEAGFGTGEHYSAGGKVYRFSDKLQSALLGMFNNINEFGYTENNMKQWGGHVEGENISGAGGLNLSYNLKGNNRYFVSYLASSTKKRLDQIKTSENFLKDGTYNQGEELLEEERNTPHKINFGVRQNFNGKHNLIIDGDVNIASIKNNSQALTQTSLDDQSVNTLNNLTDIETSNIQAEAKGIYTAKINKDITQIKTSISTFYRKNSSLLNWEDSITFYSPDSLDLFSQFRDEHTDRFTVTVNPTLVQKIRQFWYLSAGVQVGSDMESLSRFQEILGEDGLTVSSPTPDLYTQRLSVKPALSLKRNSNKTQLNFILGTSWDQFNKVLDGASVEKPVYFHFLPGFYYEFKYRKGRRINVRYSSSANMPSVNQLYPVTNTLNLISVYVGNLDLVPEYSHNLYFSWWYFDQFSFTSLFAKLGANYTKDKIGWSRTTNDDLVTEVTPVNAADHRSAYSYFSFSTPIRPLGVKVNLISHENWSRGLSIINAEENIQTNFIHSLRIIIENRKKEKWDLAVGSSVAITDANFSITSMNSVYFNTNYYADIRFTPNEKWNFETKANVVDYNSRSFEEGVTIPLITAGISYYFLPGERASFTLRGYDILNQYVGFERISDTNFLMQREWNTLGRYVMLEFNLRIGK